MGKLIKGTNDLATINPTLVEEWDYLKNGELFPDMVSAYSSRKVFWTGKCGHSWSAQVGNRHNGGAGCPFCSNHRVLVGFNDLATKNPALALEWNYEKNGELLPTMVTRGSAKKVWWRCKNNHEWQACISDRNNKHGCPFCNNCISGEDDLETLNPELALEWHPSKNKKLLPSMINAKSTKKVWWLGKCGHEWQATVGERNRTTRKGSGCPICNKGKRTSFPEHAVFYYVHKFFPDAIKNDRRYGLEFDIYIPSVNTAIEYDGYLWHSEIIRSNSDIRKNVLCQNKKIKLIRIREKGLSCYDECICVLRKDDTDNDLKNVISIILAQLLCVTNTFTINLDEDRPEILSDIAYLKESNSLAEVYPAISAEWHQTRNGTLTPLNISCHSGQKVWWKCSVCQYEWQSMVVHRTKESRKASGCPVCAGTIVVRGLNDFESSFPEISKEWHPTKNGKLFPWLITKGSHRKVWWMGQCGHEWEAYTHHRVKGTSCPYCTNKSVLAGYNDLKTTNPELLEEWDYEENNISPEQITSGSAKDVLWKCLKGHKYKMPISRRKAGSGCPYCAGQKILSGYNDISTTRPDLAEIWHPTLNQDLQPNMITEHSNKRIWWKCKQGHEWSGVPNGMKNNKCPYCEGRKVLVGYNDLKTKFPELVHEWDYLKNESINPEEFTGHSSKKAWWVCNMCGNSWESTICNRALNKSGCPICSRKRKNRDQFLSSRVICPT